MGFFSSVKEELASWARGTIALKPKLSRELPWPVAQRVVTTARE